MSVACRTGERLPALRQRKSTGALLNFLSTGIAAAEIIPFMQDPVYVFAKLRMPLIGLIFSGMTLWPVFGDATTFEERSALAALISELDALETLIDEAEVQASHDARIHFRYDWLRQDLEKVRRGIEEHLEAPRTEPRPVPPLRGDYRQ